MTRIRAWLATGLSALSLALLALTVAVPDWVEEIFRVAPDGGGGSLEVIVTLGLLVVSVVSGLGAMLAWRSLRSSAVGFRR